MHPHLQKAIAALLPAVFCQGLMAQSPDASAPVTDGIWVTEARGISEAVPPKLVTVLVSEIQKGGPVSAINVCKEEAPKMARAASEKTGWQIRRVSLGNRNPKAVPDAWEKATLEAFERRLAEGAEVTRLERAEVVVEDGQPVRRYMRALPVQKLCLQCHGTPETLGAGVAPRLTELYPQDRALGYLEGQIRGAMSLRQPAR